MRFKAILTVTKEGVVTGDYWKGLEAFEFRKAAESEKIREKQRLDDLERAYSAPGAVVTMRKKGKKSPSTTKPQKKATVTCLGDRDRKFATHGIQVG